MRALVLALLLLLCWPHPLSDHTGNRSERASRSQQRVEVFEATAYAPTGHRTKSGTWPQVGRTIAVDPDVIPLGSKVTVNGREYVAEDSGRLIRGKRVDVFLGSRGECRDFGRQMVIVEVIPNANR